jgi:hypothetical protein
MYGSYKLTNFSTFCVMEMLNVPTPLVSFCNINYACFLTCIVSVCFLWFQEQISIVYRNIFKWFIVIICVSCVFCDVGTGILCMTLVEHVSLKTVSSISVHGHQLLSHAHPNMCQNFIVWLGVYTLCFWHWLPIISNNNWWNIGCVFPAWPINACLML